MRNFRKILLGVLALVVFALCSCAVLDDAAKLEAYDFGGDRIPSLSSVAGERKVTSVESGSRTGGVEYKNFSYESSSMSADMDAYFAALKDAGFIVTKDSAGNTLKGSVELGCDSVDEGKIILINLAWDNSIIEVQISKGDGVITPN
jgi:hypothetical protein